MSQMRESSDGGGERSAQAEGHQETDWLEYLTVISDEGQLLAWAGPGRWRWRQTEALSIIAVPQLWLSQTMVYRLVHSRGLPDVFRGATATAPGLNFLPLSPVSGRFPLYTDGKPVLLEAGFVLAGSNPTSIGEIVKEVASLLT